jgi:nucleotide-binding universal stress UspA family protein
MTGESRNGPVLFCFDGSDGSREAMRAAVDLIDRPADAVVLTVWETVATRLALAGAFAAGYTTDDADLDAEEESNAKSVAEEGALRAREHGYEAAPMTRESFEGIPKAILETADHLSARLIVCGQRGSTQRFAWQRLSHSGVTYPTPDPHCSRTLRRRRLRCEGATCDDRFHHPAGQPPGSAR